MGAAAAVLPEFGLLLLGVLLRRTAWRSDAFWPELERLVYLVLFPTLLLRTTLQADLGAGGALPLLAASVAATLGGAALGQLARPMLRAEPRTHSSGVQNAFRFNSYLALAIVGDLGPAATGLMGLLLGVNVPLANALAVTALARGGGSRRGVAAELVRNPLVLATVAGLAGNLAGLRLPEVADAAAARLGAAAVPLGLLTVGAALRRSGLAPGARALAAYLAAVKLVAVPVLAATAALALDLAPADRVVLIAFAAVPPATSSYILAVRMQGDGPFVAAQVSLATAASFLTLPVWLVLVGA